MAGVSGHLSFRAPPSQRSPMESGVLAVGPNGICAPNSRDSANSPLTRWVAATPPARTKRLPIRCSKKENLED